MTAENADPRSMRARPPQASMRPRPMTAENLRPRSSGRGRPDPRFNEAAADDRGKHAIFRPGAGPAPELQ